MDACAVWIPTFASIGVVFGLMLHVCLAASSRVIDRIPGYNKFSWGPNERLFASIFVAGLLFIVFCVPIAFFVSFVADFTPKRACAIDPRFGLLLGLAISVWMRRWWVGVIAKILLKMDTWKSGKNDP